MHEEIHSVLIEYLDTYFLRRDLAGTLNLFSPDIMGFGTGLDETAYTWEEFEKLYQRDLREAPNPIQYEIRRLEVRSPAPDVGLVDCELDIRTRIIDQEMRLNNLRLTLALVRWEGNWQIELMHISLPTQAHGGDEAYPIKELEERNQVLERQVKEKTAHLEEALTKIGKLAATDSLTGVFNRLKINEGLEMELLRSKRYSNALSVILLDIDHFKDVNDQFGHLTGDEVLVELAHMLSDRVRVTDLVGRWGGEEFLILCPETDLENALNLAEDIRFLVEGHHFRTVDRITISLGLTTYQNGDNRDTLINRADHALYEAKHLGRNQVRWQ